MPWSAKKAGGEEDCLVLLHCPCYCNWCQRVSLWKSHRAHLSRRFLEFRIGQAENGGKSLQKPQCKQRLVPFLEKQMLNRVLRGDKDFPQGPGKNSCNTGNCFNLLRTRFKGNDVLCKETVGKGRCLWMLILSHLAVVVFSIYNLPYPGYRKKLLQKSFDDDCSKRYKLIPVEFWGPFQVSIPLTQKFWALWLFDNLKIPISD